MVSVFIYGGTRRYMVLYYLRKTEINWQNFEVPQNDKETWCRPSGPTPAASEKSPHCLEFCFRFDKAWQHLPPQLSPAAVRRRVKQAKRGGYTDEATPRQVIEFCTFIFAFRPEENEAKRAKRRLFPLSKLDKYLGVSVIQLVSSHSL